MQIYNDIHMHLLSLLNTIDPIWYLPMQTTTLCKKMLKAAVIMFRGLPSTSSKLGLIHSRTRAPVPLEVNGFCTLPTSFTRPKITPTYQNPSKIHPKSIQNTSKIHPKYQFRWPSGVVKGGKLENPRSKWRSFMEFPSISFNIHPLPSGDPHQTRWHGCWRHLTAGPSWAQPAGRRRRAPGARGPHRLRAWAQAPAIPKWPTKKSRPVKYGEIFKKNCEIFSKKLWNIWEKWWSIGKKWWNIGENGEILGRNGEIFGKHGEILGRNDEILGRNWEICGKNGEICGKNGEWWWNDLGLRGCSHGIWMNLARGVFLMGTGKINPSASYLITSPAVAPWSCSHQRWQTGPGAHLFKKSKNCMQMVHESSIGMLAIIGKLPVSLSSVQVRSWMLERWWHQCSGCANGCVPKSSNSQPTFFFQSIAHCRDMYPLFLLHASQISVPRLLVSRFPESSLTTCNAVCHWLRCDLSKNLQTSKVSAEISRTSMETGGLPLFAQNPSTTSQLVPIFNSHLLLKSQSQAIHPGIEPGRVQTFQPHVTSSPLPLVEIMPVGVDS